MKHAMTCDEARHALDNAFDEGLEVASNAVAHIEQCPACAAYGVALAALDLSLCKAPPVQAAPALVARIQAEIATHSQSAPRPWAYPLSVAAAVLVLASVGAVLNTISWWPVVESGAWLPRESIPPEWDFLRRELTSIPVGVIGDLAALQEWSLSAWGAASGWLSAFGSGYSPWVWALFIPCVVAACALDGMEWRSRRIQRSGH